MKITHAKDTSTVKFYDEFAQLQPNAFYLDDDGCLVLTDNDGDAIAVFYGTEVYHSSKIAWPLVDTTIKKLTLEL